FFLFKCPVLISKPSQMYTSSQENLTCLSRNLSIPRCWQYHTSTRTTYSSSTTRSSTTSLESLQKPKKKSSTRSTISISVPSKLGELRVATINDDNKTTFSGDGDREDFGEKKFCDIFQGRWVRIEDRKPYYRSCPHIERIPFDCYLIMNFFNGIGKQMGDYNCSIVFVWSPFLVGDSATEYRPRMHGSPVAENLRLDLVDKVTSSAYRDADIIVFNSWRWWTNEKTNSGKNYFLEGSRLYPKLGLHKAYRKGLTTWSKWIDENIDPNKTRVVFRGYSASHFIEGRWNTG
ncbi:hypothetical protein C5167_006634, partial [Papaver somniferum]